MPRDGALLISDHPGEYVEIACTKCDRRGRYLKTTLIAKYGDIGLPDLRHDLAKGCQKLGNYHDNCGALFPMLG